MSGTEPKSTIVGKWLSGKKASRNESAAYAAMTA
jgi:hypothetical protein